jgi:hypothetical protein
MDPASTGLVAVFFIPQIVRLAVEDLGEQQQRTVADE